MILVMWVPSLMISGMALTLNARVKVGGKIDDDWKPCKSVQQTLKPRVEKSKSKTLERKKNMQEFLRETLTNFFVSL